MNIFSLLFRKFILQVILSPVIWVYWFFIISLLFLKIPSYSVISFMFLFVVFFNFVPFYLIKKLESKYQVSQVAPNNQFSHILVLGSGHVTDSNLLMEQQLNNGSLRRVLEGVRLHNINPNSLIVMSGESLNSGHPSQTEIQAKVAVTMGVKIMDIKIIPEPYNTEIEALYYHKNFSYHDNPIFLVTEALRIERALYIFSSFGYEMIPAPAYFVYTNYQPNLGWFLTPDFNLILHFGEYLKEWVTFKFLKFKISLGLKSFPPYSKNIQLRKTSFEILNR
jgi:uncharacterized SAM-binding protein YcdF (DUF218 family)